MRNTDISGASYVTVSNSDSGKSPTYERKSVTEGVAMGEGTLKEYANPGTIWKEGKGEGPYLGGIDDATKKMAEILIHGNGRSPAPSFLDEAVGTMKARATLRDQPQGERSMERTVSIFNAWTGNTISVQDGWRFMIALKQAREIQGFYNRDDYVDLSAYSALLGEEESDNKKRAKV